jgi:hypothetical protein|tara:strand:- start:6047 stop:6358 length:312 start_codon:yes stop_codon:yes gene_type:complete
MTQRINRKPTNIHPREHGRLVSIVKRIILIEKLKLELKLTPKDVASGDIHATEILIKKEIKNVQRALKNTIKLGSPMVGGYERWLVASGLNLDNFDIKVKGGK